MVKRILFAIGIAGAAVSAAAAPNDKINVCHFPAGGDVRLLSIARSALSAHLAHGDIEAPPSVRTSADCLIPQPPQQPVAHVATTDARGEATFVIPGTNVIARFQVVDANGAPVAEARAQVVVRGDDYLATVVDPSGQLAPGFAEGKLSDARPGSPLMLLVRIVMLAYSTRLTGGSMLTPGPSLPVFTGSHFAVADYCFTEQEFQSYVQSACSGVAGAAAATFFPLLIGRGGPQTVATLLFSQLPLADACKWLAPQAASTKYSGASLPIRFRVYSPVAIAGMQLFPFWFQDLDDCGGACCEPGAQCMLVSDPANCIGTFFSMTPCVADFCAKGACCTASGCTVVPEAQCNSVGGTYKGHNTTCSPDPCPSGACCDLQSGCIVMPQFLCASVNGTFHGNGSSCTNVPGTAPRTYQLLSGGGAGSAGFPIPFTHGTVKTTVTIPGNIINGQCVRNWRVEIMVCRNGGGCQGGHIYAGQHFSICHTNPETIHFEQLNPSTACSSYSVNALTGGVSQVTVEVIPP